MKYLLLLLLSCGFLSCSDRVAGGGSSGSEAGNAITAVILKADGTPASGARVRLRTVDYLVGDTSKPSFDIQTKKNGELQFQNVPAGNWNMEVDQNGHALLRKLFIPDVESKIILGSDTLRPVAGVHGSIPLPFPQGTRIVIPGTEHAAVPDSQGNYVLDSIPYGFHEIREYGPQGLSDNAGYAKPAPGELVLIGPLASENTALLLEDFEDGDSRHRYADFSGSGWWYLSMDTLSVSVTPIIENIPIPLDADPVHSKVLHFKATFDLAGVNSWLDCGVQIGEDDQSYDLSSVDSLVFWAKGMGVALVTLHFPNNMSNYGQEPEYSVSLPLEWTRISIPMDSFGIPGVQNQDPQAIRSNLRAISWVFNQDAELWLDDVSLIGASRSEIWKP